MRIARAGRRVGCVNWPRRVRRERALSAYSDARGGVRGRLAGRSGEGAARGWLLGVRIASRPWPPGEQAQRRRARKAMIASVPWPLGGLLGLARGLEGDDRQPAVAAR